MTESQGGATPPEAANGVGATGAGASGMPGADVWRSLSRQLQIAAIGAAVAGLYGLLRVVDPTRFGSEPAGAIVAIAALAVIFLLIGRGRSHVYWFSLLAALGLGLLILAALDLWSLLEDLDDADDYGGGLALPGRIVYLAGALALVVGGWSAWMSRGGAPRTFVAGLTRGQNAERAFVGGALIVILAWIGMIVLGTGWELAFLPGIAIAAAVLGLVAGDTSGTDARPVGAGVQRILLIVLAAIVAWAAIETLGEGLDAWDLITEFAGPLTYLPFIAFVIGAVVMAAGAVLGVVQAQTASQPSEPREPPAGPAV